MKIVLSVVLAFFLSGCSEESSKEVQTEAPKQVLKESVQESPLEETDEQTEVVVVEDVVVVEVAAKDGKTIYKACSSCHGINAEKSALGKSKIIKGWDAGKVSAALNGYKDGSYGGAMKGIMKGQAGKLSDEDIEIVAEYISTL